MELKVILEHGDDGMIVAHCPSLKSCWSQGRTGDEALQNIREAVELYLEADEDELVGDANHEIVAQAL